MSTDHREEPTRAEITDAWVSGVKARQEGVSQFQNPYIGKSTSLAKEWDAGWKKGSFTA